MWGERGGASLTHQRGRAWRWSGTWQNFRNRRLGAWAHVLMEGGAPPPRARTGSVHVDDPLTMEGAVPRSHLFSARFDPLEKLVSSLHAALAAGEVITVDLLDTLVPYEAEEFRAS